MTATTPVSLAAARSATSDVESERAGARARAGSIDIPPISPRLQLVRAAVLMVAALSIGLLVQLAVVSRVQHHTAQERLFSEFRAQLAEGTAPAGPVDFENAVVEEGAPVAYLEIPSIGVSEVVVQGTTSSALFDGPGHRRDTALPGQIGTSILMGRRASYGAPFASIRELEQGATVTVTTGQGVFDYTVIGVRREGDTLPPPVSAGSSRIVLVTADGRPLMPDGVVRVDADLDGDAVVGQARLVDDDTLPGREHFMSGDSSSLWVLVLWLQAMVVVSIGAVWAWHRWGRPQMWVAFAPAIAFVGLGVAGEVARLLPNMI